MTTHALYTDLIRMFSLSVRDIWIDGVTENEIRNEEYGFGFINLD